MLLLGFWDMGCYKMAGTTGKQCQHNTHAVMRAAVEVLVVWLGPEPAVWGLQLRGCSLGEKKHACSRGRLWLPCMLGSCC